MGAVGASAYMPSAFNMSTMYKYASAEVKYRDLTVNAPSIMPQVINIFLYGGPSELAGNLTNIVDINNNSQNLYDTDGVFPGITEFQSNGGLITPNGFWSGAGGDEMQSMLDRGQLSVYRTLMKRIDGTRSHRESLLMSQKGSLDIEAGPGVGTRLAAAILQHRGEFENNTLLADGTLIGDLVSGTDRGVEAMFLPFVSFEGDTRYFQQDPDFSLPLLLRGTTLDQNLESPYSRSDDDNLTIRTALNDLVGKVMTPAKVSRFKGVVDGFALREFFEDKMAGLDPGNAPVNDTTDSSGDPLPIIDNHPDAAVDAAAIGLTQGAQLIYPDNGFTDRIRAAVTLALKNPSSLYLSLIHI